MRFIKENSLLIVIVLCIAGLSLWVFQYQNNSPTEVKLAAVHGCKLQSQTCEAHIAGLGEVTLDILPKQPTAMDTLLLSAQFENPDIKDVVLEFNGKTMEMGFLKYPLRSQSKKGLFKGKGGLSVCTLGVMEWWVTLHFKFNDVRYQLPFEMETFYNPASTSK